MVTRTRERPVSVYEDRPVRKRKKVRARDKALAVHQSERATALIEFAFVILGAVGALGALVYDWIYSYRPMLALMDSGMSMAISILTTPVQIVGLILLTDEEQRRAMDPWMKWSWYVALSASFVYDGSTNVWGLFNEAFVLDRVPLEMMWVFAIFVGLGLMMVEYLLIGVVRVGSMVLTNLRVANHNVREHVADEYDDDL